MCLAPHRTSEPALGTASSVPRISRTYADGAWGRWVGSWTWNLSVCHECAMWSPRIGNVVFHDFESFVTFKLRAIRELVHFWWLEVQWTHFNETTALIWSHIQLTLSISQRHYCFSLLFELMFEEKSCVFVCFWKSTASVFMYSVQYCEVPFKWKK